MMIVLYSESKEN